MQKKSGKKKKAKRARISDYFQSATSSSSSLSPSASPAAHTGGAQSQDAHRLDERLRRAFQQDTVCAWMEELADDDSPLAPRNRMRSASLSNGVECSTSHSGEEKKGSGGVLKTALCSTENSSAKWGSLVGGQKRRYRPMALREGLCLPGYQPVFSNSYPGSGIEKRLDSIRIAGWQAGWVGTSSRSASDLRNSSRTRRGNLAFVLDWVSAVKEQRGELFSQAELHILRKIRRLGEKPQAVVAEAFFRRGPWIRLTDTELETSMSQAELQAACEQAAQQHLLRHFPRPPLPAPSRRIPAIEIARIATLLRPGDVDQLLCRHMRTRSDGGGSCSKPKGSRSQEWSGGWGDGNARTLGLARMVKAILKARTGARKAREQKHSAREGGSAGPRDFEADVADHLGGAIRLRDSTLRVLERFFRLFALASGLEIHDAAALMRLDLASASFPEGRIILPAAMARPATLRGLEIAILRSYHIERAVAGGEAELTFSLLRKSMEILGETYGINLDYDVKGIGEDHTDVDKGMNGPTDCENSICAPDKKDGTSMLEMYQERTSSGSRFLACPVCGECVSIYSINEHLDWICKVLKCEPRNSCDAPKSTQGSIQRALKQRKVTSNQPKSFRETIEIDNDESETARHGACSTKQEERNTERGEREEVVQESFIWERESPVPPPIWQESYHCFRDILRGCMLLERERRYEDAVEVLQRVCDIPISAVGSCLSQKARFRLAQDLIHLGKKHQARNVLITALKAGRFAGSHEESLARLLKRCEDSRKNSNKARQASRSTVSAFPASSRTSSRTKRRRDSFGGTEGGVPMTEMHRSISNGGIRETVEEFALASYQGQGWEGCHTENGPFLTLYMLLFWDVIFHEDERKTASHGDYPISLRFPASASKAHWQRISKRIAELQNGNGDEILRRCFCDHKGKSAFGVNWEVLGGEKGIRRLLRGIGPDAVVAICRNYSNDIEACLGGMPDLLLWKEDSTGNLEIKLVEVKGPKDRLSDRQIAWLKVLSNAGVQVEVFRTTA